MSQILLVWPSYLHLLTDDDDDGTEDTVCDEGGSAVSPEEDLPSARGAGGGLTCCRTGEEKQLNHF